jgi:hypothetical protein
MLTEGRTDMTKLILTFRNFANAPENRLLHPQSPTYVYTAAIPGAITLHVRYIWASFAYDFIYLVFVCVTMSGISNSKSKSWVPVDWSCKALSLYFLVHSLMMFCWKLQRVHVAGLPVTKIKVVLDRCNSLIFCFNHFFTASLPSFIQQIYRFYLYVHFQHPRSLHCQKTINSRK